MTLTMRIMINKLFNNKYYFEYKIFFQIKWY